MLYVSSSLSVRPSSFHWSDGAVHLLVCLQDDNAIVRMFGEPRQEEKLYNHVDLVQLLDIVNLEAGTTVAGGRAAAWV